MCIRDSQYSATVTYVAYCLFRHAFQRRKVFMAYKQSHENNNCSHRLGSPGILPSADMLFYHSEFGA